MVRTVLVTGADSGTGIETALLHPAVGSRVVGAVRSDDEADAARAGSREAASVG